MLIGSDLRCDARRGAAPGGEGGLCARGLGKLNGGYCEAHQTPSFAARFSRLAAAISTGTVGPCSPEPGPYSSGRATCAVLSPHCAAAARSRLWAATIMHWWGSRLKA